MAFKKGFTRHKWPVCYRLQQKKKLEVFLENVYILDDFADILSFAEFQVIYMKVTGSPRTFDEVFEQICHNYIFVSSLKEAIWNEYGKDSFSVRFIKKIYNQGIDKILASGVDFSFDGYSLNISYPGKGARSEVKKLPKNTSPKGSHSYILDKPEREPVKLTDEQKEKIKSNRVLEQQEQGGLHDKDKLPMMIAQEKSIEDSEEDD